MTILISDSCISCGACVPVCPESALFLGADPKVMVDHLKCVDCGKCVPVCPVVALSLPQSGGVKSAEEASPPVFESQTVVSQEEAMSEEGTPSAIQNSGEESPSKVWVYVEHMNGLIAGVTLELIGVGTQLAKKLNTRVGVVLPGNQVDCMIQQLMDHGAEEVYLMDQAVFHSYRTEAYQQAVCYLVKKYQPEVLLIGATTTGRDLAGAVATELKTGLTADCTQLDIDIEKRLLLASRPAFGGNIMATILCENHRPQMATVRPKVMKALATVANRQGLLIREFLEIPEESIPKQILEVVRDQVDNVRLDEAKIIVSGGRGVKESRGFQMLQELADVLGGVVAGSRGAVESGSIHSNRQVGQTGQTVGPTIYFAVGISGAIQHVVGMQHSEIIIAINTDPHCTMMKMANYAIEADAYQILPLLSKAFREALANRPLKEDVVACPVPSLENQHG